MTGVQTCALPISDGISINDVKVDDSYLLRNGELSRKVIDSNLQTVGRLRELNVGETLAVVNGRVGINTESPDAALSIWDEEVCVSMGKYKNQEAYIGTNRNHAVSIGVNKIPQIQSNESGGLIAYLDRTSRNLRESQNEQN